MVLSLERLRLRPCVPGDRDRRALGLTLPRYVIIGAGAIGVTLAAELYRSGHPVASSPAAPSCRQESQRDTYARPHGTRLVSATVCGGPDELHLTGEDVLVLGPRLRTQPPRWALSSEQPVSLAGGRAHHRRAAVPLLRPRTDLRPSHLALRQFGPSTAASWSLAATYVEPGVVVAPSAPSVGIAWIGAFPDR